MESLFTCRNCVHNCGQSLNISSGSGYCLQHDSLIAVPHDTTCKYLHRKDLPFFVVDEAHKEHAAEYVMFPRMVSVSRNEPIPPSNYSERVDWERRSFDPVLLICANYHRSARKWVLIQSFAGGLDGRRALIHASLIRRYMNHCGTWVSSYRLILSLIQELCFPPTFTDGDLLLADNDDAGEVRQEAFWDVIFTRIAAIQEYGWHSGLEELLWVTDNLNGALANFDWQALLVQLQEKRDPWITMVISHAKQEGEFWTAKHEEQEDEEI